MASAETGPLTHAGTVVYREVNGGGWEFLLISANSAEQELVLPKGHIDAGEDPQQTALRELREEAGLSGTIVATLGVASFVRERESIRSLFFLVCCADQVRSHEHRDLVWLPCDQAEQAAAHQETKQILRSAREWLAASQRRSSR
jgi:8-oxo-dGTP pyrophosphatase MutT (NUDIX family)